MITYCSLVATYCRNNLSMLEIRLQTSKTLQSRNDWSVMHYGLACPLEHTRFPQNRLVIHKKLLPNVVAWYRSDYYIVLMFTFLSWMDILFNCSTCCRVKLRFNHYYFSLILKQLNQKPLKVPSRSLLSFFMDLHVACLRKEHPVCCDC